MVYEVTGTGKHKRIPADEIEDFTDKGWILKAMLDLDKALVVWPNEAQSTSYEQMVDQLSQQEVKIAGLEEANQALNHRFEALSEPELALETVLERMKEIQQENSDLVSEKGSTLNDLDWCERRHTAKNSRIASLKLERDKLAQVVDGRRKQVQAIRNGEARMARGLDVALRRSDEVMNRLRNLPGVHHRVEQILNTIQPTDLGFVLDCEGEQCGCVRCFSCYMDGVVDLGKLLPGPGPNLDVVALPAPEPIIERAPCAVCQRRSVDELILSVRTANCLANAGIRRIGQLCGYSEGDLLRLKHFGRRSLDDVKTALAECGLELA